MQKKLLKKKISTFSIIDKDHRYNESHNIECVVKDLKCGSNLISIENQKNNFFNRLNDLTNYHDGPIATLSYYVHSYLMKVYLKKIIKLPYLVLVLMKFLLATMIIIYFILRQLITLNI